MVCFCVWLKECAQQTRDFLLVLSWGTSQILCFLAEFCHHKSALILVTHNYVISLIEKFAFIHHPEVM